MSSTEEDLRKKQQEEAAKRESQEGKGAPPPKPEDPAKGYVPPNDPSGFSGSAKKEDGKDVKELNYTAGSRTDDGATVGVVQNDAKKTTTLSASIRQNGDSAEAYVTEQPGGERFGGKATFRQNDGVTNSFSIDRDNASGRTTGGYVRQDDKDRQAVTVSGGKGGLNAGVSLAEAFRNGATFKAEGSTDFKDDHKLGAGLSTANLEGAYAWTRSSGGNRQDVSVGIKQDMYEIAGKGSVLPDGSIEASVTGKVYLTQPNKPAPETPQATIANNDQLREKFSGEMNKLSPQDQQLYREALAAVREEMKSGRRELAGFEGREAEMAVNVAVQAKRLGYTSIADVKLDTKNGETSVYISDKLRYGDQAMDSHGPAGVGVPLNALEVPAVKAAQDLANAKPDLAPKQVETTPALARTQDGQNLPAQEAPVMRR